MIEIKMPDLTEGVPGAIGRIYVKAGDNVKEGSPLCTVEGGKGVTTVRCPCDCRVKDIFCEEGQIFKPETVLMTAEIKGNISGREGNKGSVLIETDLLIIGGGPAGYTAAAYAAAHGLRVTLAEKGELGGTCLNAGCIPTKALITSARMYRMTENASVFGVAAGDVQFNMSRALDHKDSIVKKLLYGVKALLESNQVLVLKGTASFLKDGRVRLDGDKDYLVKAADTIIAAGSKPVKLKIPGADLPFVADSTDALSFRCIPKKIVIVGGGVVGMELAFLYRMLSTKVCVLESESCILNFLDDDIRIALEKSAEEKGIQIFTGINIESFSSGEKEAVLVLCNKAGNSLCFSCDKVITAVGRKPDIDKLALENLNMEFNRQGTGIAVDEYMRTNIPHIYAAGDVTDIMPFAHVAYHQSMTAVNCIMGKKREMKYTSIPYVLFTEPEVCCAGKSEAALREEKIPFRVAKASFSTNGRALTLEQKEGYVKLILNRETGQIEGAAAVGADASELAGSLALIIQNKMNPEQLAETVFPHPTTGEVIHEAALALINGASYEE